MSEPPRYDYIIIGSGIAGLNTALLAANHGSVLVITKGLIDETATAATPRAASPPPLGRATRQRCTSAIPWMPGPACATPPPSPC